MCFNTHTDLGPVCINPADLWLNLSRFRRAYPLPPSPYGSTIHKHAQCTLTPNVLSHTAQVLRDIYSNMMHLNCFPYQTPMANYCQCKHTFMLHYVYYYYIVKNNLCNSYCTKTRDYLCMLWLNILPCSVSLISNNILCISYMITLDDWKCFMIKPRKTTINYNGIASLWELYAI